MMKPNITHDVGKSKSVCGEQEGDSTHFKGSTLKRSYYM